MNLKEAEEMKRKINNLYGKHTVYVDTDSAKELQENEPDPDIKDIDLCKKMTPECSIIWNHGEVTYLKGANALRIARSWLYNDPDCLMVYTSGWIYLKGGDHE